MHSNWDGSRARFEKLKYNENWLNGQIIFENINQSTPKKQNPNSGRPELPFALKGKSAKAAKKAKVSDDFKNVSLKYTPESRKQGIKLFKKQNEPDLIHQDSIQFSKQESFDFIADNDLSKSRYSDVIKVLKKKQIKLFSWESLRNTLMKSKKESLNFEIHVNSMNISINEAVSTIMGEICQKVKICEQEFSDLTLISKIGMDGAKSMQNFSFQKEDHIDDIFPFLILNYS